MTSRLLLTLLPLVLAAFPAHAGDVLTGKQALGDWTTDARRRPPEDHAR